MTSPVEESAVTCPDRGHVYRDWYRASIDLALDDFDADYLEPASTTTSPGCGAKRDFATLTVRRDDDENTIFEM